MQTQLQELLDKKACEEVLIRYGRTLDWLDTAGQAQCFWPDAAIDYGFFRGSATEWVPVVMELEKASLRRWHACNSIIVQVAGSTAKSECYGLTAGSSETEEGALECHVFGGRYLDEFEKRNGQWRIAKRTYIADWAYTFPNGLDEMIKGGFLLNVWNIQVSDHPSYQCM